MRETAIALDRSRLSQAYRQQLELLGARTPLAATFRDRTAQEVSLTHWAKKN